MHTRINGIIIQFLRVLIVVYICLRFFFLVTVEIPWEFRLLSIVFFLAELFILTQALGYFGYLKVVGESQKNLLEDPAKEKIQLQSYPSVAIVVASYKEPLSVLEDTLICFHNLTYPNKQLYFLDDTRYDVPWDTPETVQKYRQAIEELCQVTEVNLFRRKWHHAKAGLLNDFLEFLAGSNNPDFKLIRNDSRKLEKEKYIVVFDADMNAFPDFVEPLVAQLEKDPSLAFIQTPQYYTNFHSSRVARASSLMQVIFYEFICEAKGIRNLVIFCGTNVILRIDALKEVGGIDCSSVTEDFATAFKLHTKNWKSIYTKKVCAFGMAPEDLGAFFKQQHRWALGTVGLLPTLLSEFLKHPLKYPFFLWWEYFLSASYYIIGWVYLALLLGPVVFIFFDFPIYYFPPVIYAMLLLPYNVLTLYLFYSTLCRRGYRFVDVFAGVVLGVISTPVYMQASAQALLGIRGKFVVTPKGNSTALPLVDLWPQILIAIISFITCIWGILRLYYEPGGPFWGILINLIWSFYYFLIFSSIFYLNFPQEENAPVALANCS